MIRRPGDSYSARPPMRLVRTAGKNWYAEPWQKKFHYYAEGHSVCGRHWLLEGVQRDEFDHARAIPRPLRCKLCSSALAAVAKKARRFKKEVR